MSQSITLEIPDDLVRQADQIASASRRTLADFVIDGIRKAISDIDVASLPDESLVQLTAMMMDEPEQLQMSALLAKQKETELTWAERHCLERLLSEYRRGLVLKARALQESVTRGIIPPLSSDAA